MSSKSNAYVFRGNVITCRNSCDLQDLNYPNRFATGLYVRFRNADSHERIPEEGVSLHVTVPPAAEEQPGGIALEEVRKAFTTPTSSSLTSDDQTGGVPPAEGAGRHVDGKLSRTAGECINSFSSTPFLTFPPQRQSFHHFTVFLSSNISNVRSRAEFQRLGRIQGEEGTPQRHANNHRKPTRLSCDASGNASMVRALQSPKSS
jgi:hypothetical protein